jgi:hypothetical protein
MRVIPLYITMMPSGLGASGYSLGILVAKVELIDECNQNIIGSALLGTN